MAKTPLEQDLLFDSDAAVVASGFREPEANAAGKWRWAFGDRQSIAFTAPLARCRIHYCINLPLAGTRVTFHHQGKICLSLAATAPASVFEGFFELSFPELESQLLEVSFAREASAGVISSDPSLSYSIRHFICVGMNSAEEFAKIDQQRLQSLKTVLVTLPTWSVKVPPMGVACLSSALRAASVPVRVFDFNIAAWHALKHLRMGGADLWANQNVGFFREELPFHSEVVPHLQASIDQLVEEICAWKPDVLGFTAFYTSLPCMEIIAKSCLARIPGLKIVCGGPETGGANEEYRKNLVAGSIVHAAVVGEGEATFLDLLGRWASELPLHGCQGTIHKLGSGVPVVEPARASLPFHAVPFPDYSDFDLSLYEDPQALPVMMSRGCVARCSFCSETRYWQKFRSGPAERTFSHIKELVERFGVNRIYFNDSLVNGNFDSLAQLAELIVASGINIKWNGQARVDRRMTKSLLDRLAISGCEFLSYGFESGSQKVVDQMEKRSTVALAQEVIRNTHAAGISTGLNVIVGFPGEEEEDFQMTLDFLRANLSHIDQVGINEMNVFVGVPVGDDPARFGIAPDFESGASWQTLDGRNNPNVRKDRLSRINSFVEEVALARGLGSSSR